MVFQFLHRTVCFKIVILIWFIQTSENNMCERIRNDGCCNGYVWNTKTEKCTKCMPGYFGPNCTSPCPYPSYGDMCQGICNCSNDTCNVSTGCTTLTKDDETFSSVTMESTNYGENATLCKREKSLLNTDNSILINLIKILGSVDILLICAYSVVFAIDHKRHKRTIQNTDEHKRRNNFLYENIEIVILTND